jgi:hypothetical protein
MVLARACCGPSGVQVPLPQLSTDGESRPFDKNWKGLVRPSSSLTTSESNPRIGSSPFGGSNPRVRELLEASHFLPRHHVMTSEASSKGDPARTH